MWQSDHVGKGSAFKADARGAHKEETLDGDSLMEKYELKEKVKYLWNGIGHDYSVIPQKCYDSCSFKSICRVTDELKEEAEGG